MSTNKGTLATSILIMAVGLGWLLTAHKVVPGVNWVWILSLGIVGLLVPIVLGLDRITVVFSPFLIAASVFSLLRQIDAMSVDTEAPGLVAVFGALMFLAHFIPVPPPRWLIEPPRKQNS